MDECLVRRGKKRRLDHLSYDEKVQRKKLKNRVAAQTSRDRKKMKMDEMESNLERLAGENTKLKKNFRTLEATNQSLRQQNETLQQQLELLRQRMDEQEQRLAEKEQQLREAEIKREDSVSSAASVEADIALKTGSAASTDVDPQQQGLSANTEQQTKRMTTKTSSSVWQVIALCLLYKISCSAQVRPSKENIPAGETAQFKEDLICTAGRSWPKLYSQISRAKWQAMLKEAATNLPRMQAPYHSCLDSWWGPEQSAWNPVAKAEA